jgi:circadian clock protein KaiC
MSNAGLTVYPRLESRVSTVAPVLVSDDIPEAMIGTPVPFAIPGLDALLGGGLTRATTTLAAGSLGTGKTLLGLQFALAGMRAGESVVFLGFRETVEQLIFKADLLGGKEEFRAALRPGGTLTLLLWPPVELNADIVADYLLATLTRTGARRLVIDSIAELERALRATGDARRVDEYLTALVVTLRDRGVTTLALKETQQTSAGLEHMADPISMVADNVLALRQGDEGDHLRRTLTVIKMRFSAYNAAVHDFMIAPPHGIQVRPPFPTGQSAVQSLKTAPPAAGKADTVVGPTEDDG